MKTLRYTQQELTKLAIEAATDAQFEKLARMMKAGWAVTRVTQQTLAGCAHGDANIWVRYERNVSPGQAASGCLRPDGEFARPAKNQKGKFTVPLPSTSTEKKVTRDERVSILAAA